MLLEHVIGDVSFDNRRKVLAYLTFVAFGSEKQRPEPFAGAKQQQRHCVEQVCAGFCVHTDTLYGVVIVVSSC